MEKMSFEKSESKINLKARFSKALENKYFNKICKELDLPSEILMKYTSNIMECANEQENCSKCKNIKSCKNLLNGSYLNASKNNNGLTFSYVKCKYATIDKFKENITYFDLPLRIKEASISNIYNDDKSRTEILKEMKKFKDAYLKNEHPKGIYLYGNFGSGKSYLIAALFNDLAKNNIKSVMIHVPELIRLIKDSFDDYYSEMFDEVLNTPLLLLDDIGAEYLTPWARDEVLEPILQYRMDQELPTFFTSNYSIKEIENHFIINDDKMKAKRIIERIKQVSKPIELVGKNRRNE
jgi:primosomal protein DnaI